MSVLIFIYPTAWKDHRIRSASVTKTGGIFTVSYTHLDCRVYNKGPFGGVRYTPSFCKELKLMAEYDTRGWNMGAAMRFWKHLSVNVFTREFTCVSAGLRYECTLIH